jgi:hypothetical protein
MALEQNNIEDQFLATQLSTSIFEKNKEHYFLCAIAKRTYSIAKNGICTLSDKQIQLQNDIIYYEEKGELIKEDFDLYPLKPFTDVIIKGSIKGNGKSTQLHAAVEIENQHPFIIQSFGNRKAYKNNYNKIIFTEPEIIENIPLTYTNAYGGVDSIAESQLPEVANSLKKANPGMDWDSSSLYRYPRNPCGKGYIVSYDSKAFEHLELPNLEFPKMLLTTDNLILNDPYNWVKQPLPWATDWTNLAWFPRIAYIGILPFNDKEGYIKNIPEFNFNYVNTDLLNIINQPVPFNTRASNGASPGLQFANIIGNEIIKLKNIHPSSSNFLMQLPVDIPKIWVDGRNGKLLETKPVIHTILIEPDENRLSIVWCGRAPAIRPYFQEELKTMPFKVEWNKK